MENKHVTAVIFAVIVILIVAALAGRMFLTRQGSGSSSTSPGALSNSKQSASGAQSEEVIQSILRKAIDGRDASLCAQIQDKDRQAYCTTNVLITKASDTKDPSLCNQIKDPGSVTACKDNIVIVKARDAKNPSYCELMTDKSRVPQCKVTAQ